MIPLASIPALGELLASLAPLKRHLIILISAEWCPHSRSILPKMESIAAEWAKDPRLTIARMDAGKDAQKILEAVGVVGYPNLVWYEPGSTHPDVYKGKRTEEALRRWLGLRLGAPIAADSKVNRYHDAMSAAKKRLAKVPRRESASAAERSGPLRVHREGRLASDVSADRLSFTCWSRAATPTGLVVFLHGMGEHAGSYSLLFNSLLRGPLGSAEICAVDLPGHGTSPGVRGQIDTLAHATSLVHATIDRLRSTYPQTQPVTLVGHDVGGLLAIAAATGSSSAAAAVSRVIALSPWIGPRPSLSSMTNAATSLAGSVVPNLEWQATHKLGDLVSSAPAARALLSDDLRHATLRAGTVGWLSEAANGLAVETMTTPVHLAWGDADPLISGGALTSFAARNPSVISTATVPDGKHRWFDDEVFAPYVQREILERAEV
jgi:alpha-beta hydrolase superfamily lysophospholipase/thiol-disulfide isomerase/thioredoxin